MSPSSMPIYILPEGHTTEGYSSAHCGTHDCLCGVILSVLSLVFLFQLIKVPSDPMLSLTNSEFTQFTKWPSEAIYELFILYEKDLIIRVPETEDPRSEVLLPRYRTRGTLPSHRRISDQAGSCTGRY